MLLKEGKNYEQIEEKSNGKMIIMTYCLNSTELEEFLLSQLENKLIKNESLKIVVGSANQWEEKIRYVIDTNGIISFFSEVFANQPKFNGAPTISRKISNAIQEAVYSPEGRVLLSVPAIIFIEIYEKW